MQNLSKGSYDGVISYGELAKEGDFGIGTFDALDGEMLLLEGRFYQFKSDGNVYEVEPKNKTPFAQVSFFHPDYSFSIHKPLDYPGLQEYLDVLLSDKEIFYAIKIKAKFDYLKIRSIPAQSKPYPPLSEAIKNQVVFEARGREGTLVGFRYPQYMNSLSACGYHLHFISQDHHLGGHLLACDLRQADIQIDSSNRFDMFLPKKGAEK